MDQFTADPTARVFDGRVYVYPSHDIPAPAGKARADWFCMEDYHVFSSTNLTDWTDHGVIVSQTGVPWVDANKYSMWAPECVFKNGKYYFYFPAIAKAGGFRIGVAIADRPEGPFQPEAKPIDGVMGIDPCVFIDQDGAAYLYYAGRSHVSVAKLKDNMRELATTPKLIDTLPAKGLVEGPFVFARNGIYYLTYPHAAVKTERLEYATGTSPLGPFKPTGVIMDESPSGCWTNHQSIVQYNGQWYLFYHDNDLSPSFDKHRSIRADRLYFNADGTIRKVVPTLRGVGIADAHTKLQIDRYSAISSDAVAVSFLEPTNPFAGWKVSLPAQRSWVRFNAVDFGGGHAPEVSVRANAVRGGAIELRLDGMDGPVVAAIAIKPSREWMVVRAAAQNIPPGVHDLIVTQAGKQRVDLDWIQFEEDSTGRAANP